MVEQGFPPPGQGGYTGWRQGVGFASVAQAALDFGLGLQVVTPQTWQAVIPWIRRYRGGKGKKGIAGNRAKRKAELLARARRIWPGLPLGRVADQGVADAAFIAAWAALRFHGVPLPW